MEKYSLGAIPSPIDVRDYRAVCSASDEEFPDEFELWKPHTKNQLSVGSCVAHACSSAIEYFNHIQEGTDIDFSTAFIYGNRESYKGYGMYTSEAVHNLTRYGDCPTSKMMGNVEVPDAIEIFESGFKKVSPDAYPHRISSYFEPRGTSAIKSALMQYGIVIIAVNWTTKSDVDKNGILRLHPEAESCGGHCMYIYGWNTTGWKVGNSWGTTWGKKGNCILPFDEKIREVYGLVDDIVSEKVRNEKMQELRDEIARLTAENEELRNRKQEYLDKIAELSNEISEKSILLFNLQTQNAQLTDNKEELEKAIVEVQNEINEKCKLVDEAKAELEKMKAESDEKDRLMTEYKKTIEQLNKKLLEIEQPFNTKLGQVIAKVLNWILKLFGKTR